jgi:ferredoxin
MSHKISVDQDKCIGCGTCADMCSKSFKMKGSKAHVVADSECAKSAMSSCPVGAISIN